MLLIIVHGAWQPLGMSKVSDDISNVEIDLCFHLYSVSLHEGDSHSIQDECRSLANSRN